MAKPKKEAVKSAKDMSFKDEMAEFQKRQVISKKKIEKAVKADIAAARAKLGK